jgi:hypothetical protein
VRLQTLLVRPLAVNAALGRATAAETIPGVEVVVIVQQARSRHRQTVTNGRNGGYSTISPARTIHVLQLL